MSTGWCDLCSCVALDHFGVETSVVVRLLLQRGPLPLPVIVMTSKLKVSRVRRILANLLQLELCECQEGLRGVEYKCLGGRILSLQRSGRYLHTGKILYGDAAELIVKSLITTGPQCLSRVVQSVTSLMKSDAQKSIVKVELGASKRLITAEDVKNSFTELANAQFISRCATLLPSTDETDPIPQLQESEKPFLLPDNVQFLDEETLEPPTKKSRKSASAAAVPSEPPDSGILWRINYTRFNLFSRDQLIVKFIGDRVDERCGEIMRSCLRLSEEKSDPTSGTSAALSANEILRKLPPSLGVLKKMDVDQYLSVISDNSAGIFSKCDDSGGGLYVIDFVKASSELAKETLSSVVLERYGTPGVRIFRLLLEKTCLEQTELEKFALLSPKEAKDIMYTMMADRVLIAKYVPKTNDFAPSRCFYLFTVDLVHLCNNTLEHTYKTMKNLITRRMHEISENRILLDNEQKIRTLIKQLEDDNSIDDETRHQQIEEIQTGYLSPAAVQEVEKHKSHMKRLMTGEQQVDQTMFILQLFISYFKRPAIVKKGAKKQ